MIEVAAHLWMHPGGALDALRTVVDAGFESVAIRVDDPRVQVADEWPRLLDQAGASCQTVVLVADARSDFASADRSTQRAGADAITAALSLCTSVRAEMLMVIPRPLGDLSDVDAAQWQRMAKQLQFAAGLAASQDVRVTVEALNRFEGSAVRTHVDAMELARAVDAPNFGIALDCFHMNIEERDIGDAIRATGGHLFDLHIADSDRSAPGRGHLQWQAIRSALDDIAFDACLTAEIAPVGARRSTTTASDLGTQLRETHAFIRELIGGLAREAGT